MNWKQRLFLTGFYLALVPAQLAGLVTRPVIAAYRKLRGK